MVRQIGRCGTKSLEFLFWAFVPLSEIGGVIFFSLRAIKGWKPEGPIGLCVTELISVMVFLSREKVENCIEQGGHE